MITVLIGHRGVGKSQFLKRVQLTYQAFERDVLTLDLDEEIERSQGMSIEQIWKSYGEGWFRNKEIEVFSHLITRVRTNLRSPDVVMALGAGFQGELPSDCRVVWLRRVSDETGRIFLDRPRLNPDVSPTDEFHSRAQARNPRYRKMATDHYFLEEGSFSDVEVDALFLGLRSGAIGGTMTVLPHMVSRDFIERRKEWGVRYFELRNDLLNDKQMLELAKWIQTENLLVAVRQLPVSETVQSLTSQIINRGKGEVDWSLELGDPNQSSVRPTLVSRHKNFHDIESTLKDLHAYERDGYKVKYSPVIESLEDLRYCHEWWLEQPQLRAFLPRSPAGDWQWYRAWTGPYQHLAFFREDEGSSLDQPLWVECVHAAQLAAVRRQRGSARKTGVSESMDLPPFAAILGDPVARSWTPAEQRDFFAEFGWPVFRIRVPRETAKVQSLAILQKLGLRAAAITSPLKTSFFGELPVNTIFWDGSQWRVTSTDDQGFQSALRECGLGDGAAWAIWGGGGILQTLLAQLPQATHFSARSGQCKNGREQTHYDAVIWAAGSSQTRLPPTSWLPKLVLDLSYTEDSPARIYSQMVGARYISGVGFFRAQAEGQRRFWKDLM